MSSGAGHHRTLSKEDVQKILAGAEIEMKKRRRIKAERAKGIGRVSMDLKNLLKKRLETRTDRKELAKRHILKENTQERQLFGSLAGKKGGLENFLKMRPTKKKLMSLNIISEGKEGVCPAEKLDFEKKRREKRKENLALLLGQRPSAESLRKKKIIIDPDAIDRDATRKKLKSFLKSRPALASDTKVKRVVRDRNDARRKSMAEAKDILGGFLKKRVGVEQLQKKKILKDVSHIKLPNTSIGDQLTAKVLKLDIKVSSVSCGWAHSVIVDAFGVAYSFGMGQDGRLGQGDSKDISKPMIIKTLKDAGKVIQAECGDNHTVAVLANGSVYTWGMGSWGRLGHGTQENSSIPIEIKGVKGKQVSAGGYHTLVASTEGNVYAFGWNRKGQIGVSGPDHTVALPVKVGSLSGVKSVCCGTTSSGALTKEGKVFVWGSGMGLSLPGKEIREPYPLTALAKESVVDLAFGATHFVAKTTNKLLSWGSNTFGELGRDTKEPEDNVKPTEVNGVPVDKLSFISCGRNYTALLVDGVMHVSGRGSKGVLGTGKTTNESKFVALEEMKDKVASIGCGYTHTLAVTEQGDMVVCGSKIMENWGMAAFDTTSSLASLPYERDIATRTTNDL
eukprot:CAMPEP_0114526230 /NCGR_PEP_ID=MMETSP0109-20121206/22897_1 /TAXON_ID=29199 /ORGANISM="Chlorarachnion reptans, Strain CCCM449" /LENGTH=619 /DNA_ID=CAMNT_0001707965 /DNA_START=128 /DNA_END=1988 /DNA_ORIENTATION=-